MSKDKAATEPNLTFDLRIHPKKINIVTSDGKTRECEIRSISQAEHDRITGDMMDSLVITSKAKSKVSKTTGLKTAGADVQYIHFAVWDLTPAKPQRFPKNEIADWPAGVTAKIAELVKEVNGIEDVSLEDDEDTHAKNS